MPSYTFLETAVNSSKVKLSLCFAYEMGDKINRLLEEMTLLA